MTEKINLQRRPTKSPVAAGILSGICPGIGQIYNGEFMKGILFLIIFAGAISIQHHAGQPFQTFIMIGFYVFQIIEAVNTAKAINSRALAADGAETAPTAPSPFPGKPASSGSVFWGIVLMALGALFLLGNFDIIEYDRIFDFWPLIVILIGLKLIADYFLKKNNT